jgi:N-acetylglutamate synthase-like GNAT family acetyltransferase
LSKPTSVNNVLPALVEALVGDPFYRAIAQGSADHAARQILRSYFEYSLMEAERTGRLVLSTDLSSGAAAWLLPRSAHVESTESTRKKSVLRSILPARGNENYHRIVEWMALQTADLIPREAWYLTIVGVNPQLHGQGLGARLLQPTLAEADEKGATCFLETFSTRNVAFYQRLNFATVAGHLEPCTQCRYLVMRRDPQK